MSDIMRHALSAAKRTHSSQASRSSSFLLEALLRLHFAMEEEVLAGLSG